MTTERNARFLLRAQPRLVIAVLLGVLGGTLAASPLGLADGLLIGVAVAGVLFVASGWIVLWRMDAARTKLHAQREAGSVARDETVVVGFSLSGLGAVVALLVSDGSRAGGWPAAVAVVGVFMAWAALHLMYATRYAHLFYDVEPRGHGINFNEKPYEPDFKDFLYFSYNLGMTYQVSDTDVDDPQIRHVVLRHCLLAYVFGTAVLATMINLVVGALTG